ncbi:MAG: nitrate- and nitrite sensing domain-containing protein [Acidimicrobiales bacterium]|nr:nitrate- and nitrite sensing domain-containing protein [Acidimicrobiales bacterium]
MNELPNDGSGNHLTDHASRSVRIPIWLKILSALVVPLLVVAGLAWLQVRQANDKVTKVDRETSLASVASSPGGLVDALIVERGDALVSMLGIRETATFPTKSLKDSMAATDKAVTDLKKAVQAGGEEAQDAFADTLRVLSADLPSTRETVIAGTKDTGLQQWDESGASYASYTQVIDSLLDSNTALVDKITDPELRAAGETLNDVNRAHDAISNLSLSIGRTLLAPNDKTARDSVAVSLAAYSKARAALSSHTEGPWSDATIAYRSNFRYEEMELKAQDFLGTGKIDLVRFIGLNPPVKDRSAAPKGTTQYLANQANRALIDQVDHLRSDARAERNRYTILAILVVLGAALLAALMARSVSRPLRLLTAQANEMATVKLPAAVKQVLETPPGQDVIIPDVPPIEIRSRDEVQSVAAALNQVQTSALDLAVEQATLRRNIADSFVSLGRRTQNLIALQLEQISQLEDDEADPAVLESLYRLDHLATRARRNAESLVVLGGTGSQRTGGSPIGTTDIIRAALSEVEDYQRVELVHVDEAMVSGASAADLIHLLAELTENGLIFSPPDAAVEIRGDKSSGGYRITIEDRGVGMTDDKLQEANVRLAGRENFTVAPSRYLGHYVTGRLAARIGATASLRRSANGGTIAMVDLPEALLVDLPPAIGHALPPVESAEPPARAVPTPTVPATPLNGAREEHHEFKTDGRPPVAPTVTAPASASGGTTSSGLRKRVPGQHVKPGQITGPMIPRNPAATAASTPAGAASQEAPSADPVPTPEPVPAAAPDPAPTPAAETPTSPSLASLLTAYTAGTERGRSEAPDLSVPLDGDILFGERSADGLPVDHDHDHGGPLEPEQTA